MRSSRILVAGAVSCVAFLLVLLAAFLSRDFPAFGAPMLDSANLVLSTAVSETGAANNVCAVVLDIRGYDTLGEATILLTAVTGVIVILGRRGSQ